MIYCCHAKKRPIKGKENKLVILSSINWREKWAHPLSHYSFTLTVNVPNGSNVIVPWVTLMQPPFSFHPFSTKKGRRKKTSTKSVSVPLRFPVLFCTLQDTYTNIHWCIFTISWCDMCLFQIQAIHTISLHHHLCFVSRNNFPQIASYFLHCMHALLQPLGYM